MLFCKLIIFIAFTIFVNAHEEHNHHPNYKFEYGVTDPHTGDHHSQWETRDGDHVKGEYTLNESDGTKRIVEYTSDKHVGFNAVVKRIGHADHSHNYHHDSSNGYGHGGSDHLHGLANSFANHYEVYL